MLHRLAAWRVAVPAIDWRRLSHTVGQGLTNHAAAAVAHEQHSLAGAVRARQIRPRRIAVLGATGGVGTTTVGVLLASVLAATRDEQALLITTHADGSDAAARLAISQAPSVTAVVAGLHRLGRIPPTPVTPSGVRVLGAPPPGGESLGSGLGPLLDVAASGHGCVVVDAGVGGQIADLSRLVDLVDTVVLVCATTPDAVQAASRVRTRWVELPSATCAVSRLLFLPVQSRTVAGPRSIDPVQRLRAAEDMAHWIPHDRQLARGAAIDLSTLSGRALTALLTLAADIMGNR